MQISANGITLEVEDHGPTSGEPLLLIMGLGMQLVAWPDGFVKQLVAQGFRVIRFDNRDAGLSQSFDAAGVPNMALAALQHVLRMPGIAWLTARQRSIGTSALSRISFGTLWKNCTK